MLFSYGSELRKMAQSNELTSNGIYIPQLLASFKQSREITSNLWKKLTPTSPRSEYSAAWLKTVEILISNQLSAGINNRNFWSPYKNDLRVHRDLAFQKNQPLTEDRVEELREEFEDMKRNVMELEDLNDADPAAQAMLKKMQKQLVAKRAFVEEQENHRKYFLILHDKLKIIKQIQDLCLQELFLIIPKIIAQKTIVKF